MLHIVPHTVEREVGDPVVYDMVTNAREFLTQKATFVPKEDYARVREELRSEAEAKRRLMLHKKRVAEGRNREVRHKNF